MSTTTDPRHAIRAAVLAECVTLAETAHTTLADLYGAAAPTREAAIVAVLDEAHAYWSVNGRDWREVQTVEAARELADDLRDAMTEQARSIVFDLVDEATRRRAFASVVADMRGAGDDDGS